MSGVPSAFTSPTATRAPVASPSPYGFSVRLRGHVGSSKTLTVGTRPVPAPVTIAGAGTSVRLFAAGPADVIAMIEAPQTRDGTPRTTFERLISNILLMNTRVLERAQKGPGTDHLRGR